MVREQKFIFGGRKLECIELCDRPFEPGFVASAEQPCEIGIMTLCYREGNWDSAELSDFLRNTQHSYGQNQYSPSCIWSQISSATSSSFTKHILSSQQKQSQSKQQCMGK